MASASVIAALLGLGAGGVAGYLVGRFGFRRVNDSSDGSQDAQARNELYERTIRRDRQLRSTAIREATHRARSTLTGVVGPASLIQHAATDPKMRGWADQIAEAGRLAEQHIRELGATAIDPWADEPVLAPVAPAAVVAEVADQHGGRVTVTNGPECYQSYYLDREQIATILGELLEASSGTVDLAVQCQDSEETTGAARTLLRFAVTPAAAGTVVQEPTGLVRMLVSHLGQAEVAVDPATGAMVLTVTARRA